jgi:hypothetical protein
MAADEVGFVDIMPGQHKFTIKDVTLTVAVTGKQASLAAGRKFPSWIERSGLTFADIRRSPDGRGHCAQKAEDKRRHPR